MLFNRHLSCARLDSTASETCQSSNKFGYSWGSANDSAAFGLTFMVNQRINVKIKCILLREQGEIEQEHRI